MSFSLVGLDIGDLVILIGGAGTGAGAGAGVMRGMLNDVSTAAIAATVAASSSSPTYIRVGTRRTSTRPSPGEPSEPGSPPG